MEILVVGKGGTLGAAIARRLDCAAIELRANDSQESTAIDEVTHADVVVNASGPRVRAGLDAADYFREHVGIASRVVKSMRRGTHLVHIGSTAVYGARGALVTTDDVEAPTRFPSPAYASAKLAAEAEVRALSREGDVHVTVLRPSMVYGPSIDSALASILRLATRGVSLRFTPGRIRQHLVYIDLFLDAVTSAAKTPADHERILLLADPFVLTNRDLVRPGAVPLIVPLRAATMFHAVARRAGLTPLSLEALAVLAMDNEFAWQPAFDALDLDPSRYGRAQTFDAYWSPRA